MGLVLLSGLDSNKYQTILSFKKHLAEHPELQVLKSISDETTEGNHEIDEFGEVAVKKIRRAQKRLTPAEITVLISRYLDGKEPSELGEEFGIHRITVSKILRRNGVPIRNTCPRKTHEKYSEKI